MSEAKGDQTLARTYAAGAGAESTLRANPDASPAALPVLMDSGIRRGSDVLKAVALGADAVGLGRPYVWGLAVGGRAGVEEVIRALAAEVDLTMALVGAHNLGELDRGWLARPG